MIDRDETYKMRSKSAHCNSCKAENIKSTRGVSKNEENYFYLLFSWFVMEFMKLLLHAQNVQIKVFSQINFRIKAVPF